MKSIKNIAVSLLALLGLVVMPLAASTTAARARGEAPGLFDYYVLSLSWSPTYCLSKKGRRDRKQCRPGAGHGFVIHGLWPQFRRGWPSQCRGAARFVPDRVIREVLDVMPSRGLVIHEWRKHGTCSGLSPRAYFALAEKLFRRINIPRAYLRPATALRRAPRQIREDFARANPGWTPDMFAPVCKGRGGNGLFTELRVCFTPTGHPSRCGTNEAGACRARMVTLPPVR